jgi:GT2 family glycosyltransferase
MTSGDARAANDSLSVVVVTWNSRDALRRCLLALAAQTVAPSRIVVVDNGSTDGSTEMVRQSFPHVRSLPLRDNLGFAEACNRGITETDTAWVATLNDDVEVAPDWTAAISAAACEVAADVGMLQSHLLFRDPPDRINSTGILLKAYRAACDRDCGVRESDLPAERAREIFCPTAGAAGYRRQMLDEIAGASGPFDPTLFVYYSDVDLGWRAQLAGWRAWYVRDARAWHVHAASTRRWDKKRLLFDSRKNRAVTLTKNASVPFLLSGLAMLGMLEIAWTLGPRGLWHLAQAVGRALPERERVATLAKVPRRRVEDRWRGRNDP